MNEQDTRIVRGHVQEAVDKLRTGEVLAYGCLKLYLTDSASQRLIVVQSTLQAKEVTQAELTAWSTWYDNACK